MSAVFVVCNRRNLTCRYCNSPFLKDKELSLDEIEQLFTNLKKMGVYRLGLTGGEPLLRDDIGEIIDRATRRNFYVSLNSNLLLYHEKPHVFDKVRFAFTSLDGDLENHEHNRGSGSFEGILAAISDLRRRRIPVVAITVIDETSALAVDQILDYAQRFDFKVHFQIKGTGETRSEVSMIRGKFSESFSPEAYRQIWQNILAKKSTTRVIASSRRYLETVANWPDYRSLAALSGKNRCAAGYGYIFVNSAGFAFPCSIVKKSVTGLNLLSEDWNKSYRGEKPCNHCICGPYLQLNLLYTQPMRAMADLYAGYGGYT